MKCSDVHYDCSHFRTGIPCIPNKKHHVKCSNCTYYSPIKTRVLIIKLGALGDVIRTTPLVERFRKAYPGVHITWLTQSPAILPTNEIESIYKWDFTSVYTIEHSEFDFAVNLDKEPEACMLLANVNAATKYGYIWKDNHIAPATSNSEHKLMTGFFDEISQKNTKSYLQEIFEICHFEFNNEEYLIQLNSELSQKWEQQLNQLSNGRTIVGLNTGCGPRWNTRLWSEESWKTLAKLLVEKGYYPVFLGGELEHEKNKRMSQETETYYPGHFSLEEFIAITNNCTIIVTQVSMMMHIATALKKKMVLCNTIFNKHEFELYGRGILVEPPTPCECFYGNTCKKGISCMNDIQPTDFMNAIEQLERF